MNAWLDPTLFDADSFPEIRLMVQSEVNSTKKRTLKLNKDPFFGPLSAKILIKNIAVNCPTMEYGGGGISNIDNMDGGSGVVLKKVNSSSRNVARKNKSKDSN